MANKMVRRKAEITRMMIFVGIEKAER